MIRISVYALCGRDMENPAQGNFEYNTISLNS
jgi:hypothetical protein